MVRLSDPEAYRTVRHGYSRRSGPVNYVRHITELATLCYRVSNA